MTTLQVNCKYLCIIHLSVWAVKPEPLVRVYSCMKDEEPKEAESKAGYHIPHLAAKFGISEAEVYMALAEIHYASPEELEDYLKVKYRH